MDVYYSICWAFEMFHDFSTSFKKSILMRSQSILMRRNWPVFKSLTLPPGVWLWANYLITFGLGLLS